MGLIKLLRGDRIYLDANIWIYALEDFPDYSEPITDLFTAADEGSLTLVTSELTLAEILVKPIRTIDTAKQRTYTETITSTNSLTAVPASRSILIQAAEIRASTKLKLPDAIHAATALSNGCTTFLTNDKQFRTVLSLHTLLLSQVALESEDD